MQLKIKNPHAKAVLQSNRKEKLCGLSATLTEVNQLKLGGEEKIANRHSHEVEADYVDWEMLEMEKKELEACLLKTQAAAALSMEGLTTEK